MHSEAQQTCSVLVLSPQKIPVRFSSPLPLQVAVCQANAQASTTFNSSRLLGQIAPEGQLSLFITQMYAEGSILCKTCLAPCKDV